ncbi:unnamed protein product [Ceutorhynchus assimilis]|uniref:C2H2-type domain-containing protein n=1 Tax=Ceutorhynchus assimilis TaxID=467358 RepID=A0A9N9N2E4_9CUCU|nr:unnamed protein product [Ceutorhynchus assimilis]
MLAFMYRGQCVVSKDQLPNLLSIAKLLKIQGLCDMKVPEKDASSPITETIPLLPPSPDNYCDKIVEEKTKHESSNNNRSSIVFRRHSSGSSTAINLSIDKTPEIPSPRSIEDQPLASTKKQDSSETCKCFLCGKYLSNQYNLRVHMETHEEAFHACQCCPHVSRSRDALRKHVSYRHPEEYLTRKRKKMD